MTAGEGLAAQLAVSRGSFSLDVEFVVPRGGVLAVLGPNGSGKSTTLGCLAGQVGMPRGRIDLDGRDLRPLPPHARRVGLLAQDALLFPHLSVLANVAFGPRSRGASRAEADRLGRHWLAEVGAAEFAERKPAQLSGGQAQRVAVARALATDPDLLLLDEPLAALDVDAAPAVRALLRRVLHTGERRRATVLVTHDPLDALALADHVVILDRGRIVERGSTKAVLAAPRTVFAARIAGLNLVSGTATESGLRTDDASSISGMLADDAVLAEPAVAVFPPSSVSLFAAGTGPAGSARNSADAVVVAVEPHGPVVRVRLGAGTAGWVDGLAADLTPAAVAELGLEPGRPVRAAVKATAVEIHPAAPAVARPDGP